MAHGFLSYEDTRGDNFWKNSKDLYNGLNWLRKQIRKDLGVVNANIKEVRDIAQISSGQTPLLKGGNDPASPQGSPLQRMLSGSSLSRAALPGAIAANPEVMGGPLATAGFSGKRIKPEGFVGDAIVDIGATSLGIERDIGGSGMFAKRLNPVDGGESGEVVQAIDRLTFVTMSLVAATKEQTQQQMLIAAKQQQSAEKMARDAKSLAEENALEMGSDLSGNLAYEKLANIAGGAGGAGRGGRGLAGFGAKAAATNLGKAAMKRGGARAAGRLGAGLGKKIAGKSGAKIGAKIGAKTLGGVVGKKLPFGLGLAVAGGFAADRFGKGDVVGGVGEILSGLAAIVPGVGTAASLGIDGLLADRDFGLTPFARGGIITQPTAGLVGEAGDEGVFPLEGPRGKKTFKMFGEGIFQAQKANSKEFAKIQSMGMKQYYENEGGFQKMAEGLKDFFSSLAGGIASLFTNNANAATRPTGGGGGLVDPTISGDEEEYLMRLMIAEAGGEGEVGMAAVGRSVLNRAGLIQSGEVRPGMFNAASGSIMDVINASGQYQPVSQGKLKRDLSPEERARAKKALEMARNQASLRGNLEAQGMSSSDINKIMASTGFRTHSARYDASQEVNNVSLGAHRFNTAGNAKMLTPGEVKINTGIQSGTGMATFGESGSVTNAENYVHGHFQTDTGTKADLVNDVAPIVRGLLNSGVTDVSITSGETFRANMSDAEIKGLIEKGIAKHTHSGDGRSVDIFVPKGTPVPFPLADVKNTGGSGGITGILPGSGKVWVGHLDPKSKSGGRAHSPNEPNMAGANTPGPQAAAPAGSYNIPGAPELSNILNASNPNTGTPIMATSAQVAMAASSSGNTVINNNYFTGGNNETGGNTGNVVAFGPSANEMGTSNYSAFNLQLLGNA